MNINKMQKRLLAILIAVAFIFCLITARLFYVQTILMEGLQKKALDQWTRDLPISAPRGKIYDRNGVILAGNETTYDLYARRQMIKDKVGTASKVAKALNLDEGKVLEKISKKVSEVKLKSNLSENELESLKALNISGLYFSLSTSRVYPFDSLLSQTLGFVSSDGEGQSGLESYYNQHLSGEKGKILTQSDLVGEEIDSTEYVLPAINGNDIHLTIDVDIQKVLENALLAGQVSFNPLGISAIVVDTTNGEVLALGNYPTLNLNDLPRDDLSALLAGSRNTLITDVYEPGSTFKIITSAINLEEHFSSGKGYSPSHIFSSQSVRVVDGQTIKCWDKHLNGKHSALNLSGALDNSCNPIFVDLALKAGTKTFYSYLEKFGFGRKTGIDFSGEGTGLLLKESSVKPCDLARIGFGQTIAVTSLQLAMSVSAVVNGGTLFSPRLLKEVKSEDGRKILTTTEKIISHPISQKTSDEMKKNLISVVENGSGKKAKIDGYTVGGKTGTAQKYLNGAINRGHYISSFVGFLGEDAKYLCLLTVNEPEGIYYGSQVAAPLVRQIFEGIIAIEQGRTN